MSSKEYTGSKKACDFCKLPFEQDIPIFCDYQQNLIFCLPESGEATAGCATRWTFANGMMVIAEYAIFRGGRELPGYGGALDSCGGCGHDFARGEIIFVDGVRQVAICGATVEDCVERWKLKLDQPEAIFQGERFRFHGNT